MSRKALVSWSWPCSSSPWGDTLVIGEDMAVMSQSGRDGVTVLLALLALCANLGSAVGSAVSGAM